MQSPRSRVEDEKSGGRTAFCPIFAPRAMPRGAQGVIGQSTRQKAKHDLGTLSVWPR